MTFQSPLLSTRDLRSASIPRLRHASQRQKYGSHPPPTDAFVTSDPPDSPHQLLQVELGKPTSDLTPEEKYRVAQNSVGRLIGKRVNRNNQRTGERDPWSYWGRGRRWAKRERTGQWVAGFAKEILEEDDGDIDAARGDLVQERHEHEYYKRASRASGNVMITMKDVSEKRDVAFRYVRQSQRDLVKPNKLDHEETWELVAWPWEPGHEADKDDWELVSVHSAPGRC